MRGEKRKQRYRGVWWESSVARWTATFRVAPGRSARIGRFASAKAAAVAYDRVALHLLGTRAERNFPTQTLAPASIDQIRRELRIQAKERRATSRFVGVYLRRSRRTQPARPWCAEVRVGAEFLTIGSWRTEKAAAVARDRALLFLHGNSDALAFPREARALGPASVDALRAECERARKAEASSRFRGVTWVVKNQCWRARIRVNGVLTHLGLFEDEGDAASAYDFAARREFGNAAKLNFPKRAARVRSS